MTVRSCSIIDFITTLFATKKYRFYGIHCYEKGLILDSN